MHPYDHGVRKKRTTYLSYTGREFISTGTLLTLPHHYPTLRLCFQRWNILNSRVERTVILNEITQDNNKVLGEDTNKTVKFHRLERIIGEAVSTFQSMVEAEQLNFGPQQK